MSIEKNRLRLLPHDIVQTSDGGLVLVTKDGAEAALPLEFKPFYQWVQEGRSISKIAKFLRSNGQSKRFASLSRFLCFLSDHGLLADKDAVRVAESMRTDHRWPESIAFEALLEGEIFRLPRGRVRAGGAVLASAFVFLIGIVSVLSFTFVVWRDAGDFSTLANWSPFNWLVAFVAVFSCGRSFRSICQALILRYCAGAEVSFRLRIEPISLSLSANDLSSARGNAPTLIGGWGAAMALAFPCVLIKLVPALQDKAPAVALFTGLLLLADFSPFVQSASTDLLRAFYNFVDGKRDQRVSDSRLERMMKFSHILFCVVWCLSFGLYMVGPWLDWGRSMRALFDPSSKPVMVGLALVVLSQGVILFSFLNDLMSSVAYGTGAVDDRRLVRRLWKRKHSGLAVEEAILQGRSPERSELETLPLLRQLDPDLRTEWLKRAKVISLSEGETVCRQGGTDRSLYIVLQGKLAVAKGLGGRKRKVVAFLEAGAVFGEAAFFLGQTRTADVVCMESSVLLEITHDPSVQALDRARSEELQLRIWFLQALLSGSFLRELPSEALDALVFAGRKIVFQAGAHVMREGEDGDACYFIVQGKATVLQNGRVINKMQNGDAFGEIALLHPGSPRTATVVADSDMIVVGVESERFWDLLASHLPLAVEIERLADRRLESDRARATRAAS